MCITLHLEKWGETTLVTSMFWKNYIKSFIAVYIIGKIQSLIVQRALPLYLEKWEQTSTVNHSGLNVLEKLHQIKLFSTLVETHSFL